MRKNWRLLLLLVTIIILCLTIAIFLNSYDPFWDGGRIDNERSVTVEIFYPDK